MHTQKIIVRKLLIVKLTLPSPTYLMSRTDVLLVHHNPLLIHSTDMCVTAVYKTSAFQIIQNNIKSPQHHVLLYTNKEH